MNSVEDDLKLAGIQGLIWLMNLDKNHLIDYHPMDDLLT